MAEVHAIGRVLQDRKVVHVGRTPHFLHLHRLMMLVLNLWAISAHDIPATSLKSSLCLSGLAGRDHQQQRYRQGHQSLTSENRILDCAGTPPPPRGCAPAFECVEFDSPCQPHITGVAHDSGDTHDTRYDAWEFGGRSWCQGAVQEITLVPKTEGREMA